MRSEKMGMRERWKDKVLGVAGVAGVVGVGRVCNVMVIGGLRGGWEMC